MVPVASGIPRWAGALGIAGALLTLSAPARAQRNGPLFSGIRNPAILDPRTGQDFKRPFFLNGTDTDPALNQTAAPFWPFSGGFYPFCTPYYYPSYPVYTVPTVGIYNPFGYGYGTPYAPFRPSERVYVERQLIVLPQNGGGGNGGRGNRSPESRRGSESGSERERPTVPERKDGFYLRNAAAEPLAEALGDIRRAWLNGDYDRLKDRFLAEGKVRVYPGGKFAYALSGSEFRRMTRDALAAIETTAFAFDPVKQAGAETAFVTGKHTFKATGPDGKKMQQEVFISYRLERLDGMWRIVEAGSAPQPIAAHQE